MKILQVIPTYLPATRYGGPVLAVHGLAQALVKRGHEVAVFTTDLDGESRVDRPDDGPVEIDGVSVRYFRVRGWRRLHRAPRMSRALAETMRGYDVAHLHSLFLWPTLAAARAAQKAGTPYFVSPRGMLVPELFARRGALQKRLWMRLFERATLEHAAGVVVTSPREAQDVSRFGLRLSSLEVVPNGIDPEAFVSEPATALPAAVEAARRGRPYLLFLGRISWKKGLEHVLEALPVFAGVRLVVAGPDDERLRPALARRAERLGCAERIQWLGTVGLPEKAALLRSAAALVLPSLSENFGNVVLEALASGCPVATTSAVGLAPCVAESGAGRVVDRGAEIGEAIGGILQAAEPERARMREAGLQLVRERFAWPRVAEQMEAVYAKARAR
jgi:glycosyltransferase involved in cell wall biosynthesis